jgi:putative tricarboxylic transport membrane protein
MMEVRLPRLAVGILGVLVSIIYLAFTLNYPMGGLANPGPGVFPLFVGILLLISSIGISLRVKSGSTSGEAEWPKGKGRARVLAILAACLMYVVALPYLGYLIDIVGVSVVVLHVMGMRSWAVKIGVALVTGILSLLLFNVVLGVQLPQGIIQIF